MIECQEIHIYKKTECLQTEWKAKLTLLLMIECQEIHIYKKTECLQTEWKAAAFCVKRKSLRGQEKSVGANNVKFTQE